MVEVGALEDRLSASANRLAELDEATRAERARRDELIQEGYDTGWPWRKLAQLGRCSVALCRKIVAG